MLAARHYARQQRRFPSRDGVHRRLLDATRLSWHMPRVPGLVSPIAANRVLEDGPLIGLARLRLQQQEPANMAILLGAA